MRRPTRRWGISPASRALSRVRLSTSRMRAVSALVMVARRLARSSSRVLMARGSVAVSGAWLCVLVLTACAVMCRTAPGCFGVHLDGYLKR